LIVENAKGGYHVLIKAQRDVATVSPYGMVSAGDKRGEANITVESGAEDCCVQGLW